MNIINDIIGLFSIKAWKRSNIKFKEDFNEKIIKRLETYGQFEYLDNGFRIQNKVKSIEANWTDIGEIRAYKVDLLIEDEISLDIIINNSTITISEETSGYYLFIKKMKEIFPNSVKDWEAKILKPAFAENLIIQYKSTSK